MNPSVSDIFAVLCRAFPLKWAESFDNCGFLLGHALKQVSSVLVSLDITEQVASEAISMGADLIVAHHPMFFGGFKKLTDETSQGRCALMLAENRIAAICMHTNADSAEGGVNDLLAKELGLSQISPLGGGESGGLGRIGFLGQEQSFFDFMAFVKNALATPGLRYEDAGRPVSRVAVGGGACGDLIELAAEAGADTYVTADVKYHQFQLARDTGINLIDSGHYATENLICRKFARLIRNVYPELSVSITKSNPELPGYFNL